MPASRWPSDGPRRETRLFSLAPQRPLHSTTQPPGSRARPSRAHRVSFLGRNRLRSADFMIPLVAHRRYRKGHSPTGRRHLCDHPANFSVFCTARAYKHTGFLGICEYCTIEPATASHNGLVTVHGHDPRQRQLARRRRQRRVDDAGPDPGPAVSSSSSTPIHPSATSSRTTTLTYTCTRVLGAVPGASCRPAGKA